MRRKIIFGLILTLSFLELKAQDEYKESKWAFRGYIKNMSTFSWTPYLGDTLWYDNLTHNRLNLAWYPDDEFSIFIEMRNRLFVGSSVSNIPSYGELIDSNNDFFNLSYNVIDTENAVLT